MQTISKLNFPDAIQHVETEKFQAGKGNSLWDRKKESQA
jgi:hypothetical protein